ncbi:hypothetical protein LJC14_06985 [Treponema sp. OttesenSCG-928-L16]|nr:hypothetical protein [Treponema sp. OttesenSCG-928-L16]
MKEPGFLTQLSQYLFWDYDVNMLDPNDDKKLIVERVFTRGTEKDEKKLFNYYGKDIIKDCVLNIKYFDKKTLNYLSIIFNISKEQFVCYKQSLLETPFGIS